MKKRTLILSLILSTLFSISVYAQPQYDITIDEHTAADIDRIINDMASCHATELTIHRTFPTYEETAAFLNGPFHSQLLSATHLTRWSWSSDGKVKIFFDTAASTVYQEAKQCEAMIAEAAANGILTGDDREKITKINQYLIDTLEYDTGELNGAYLGLTQHRTKCFGYTQIFDELRQLAGIAGGVVVSEQFDHSWNYVIIDGQRYECDSTWNDTYGNEFLLITPEAMLAAHLED